jgi:glycosyltransferase involved in cell wall biosynthesis
MKILIVDAVCPKPYDPQVFANEALGGTEGTVIRVAEGLAAQGIEVRVTQHNRKEEGRYGAVYTQFGANNDYRATHVIVLRAPLVLRTARKQYPNAKLFLWCHDLFSADGWNEGFRAVVETQTIPVVVSDFHKTQMYDVLRAIKFEGQIPSRRIYNPIDEDLRPDGTPVDKNKLVFFSSPHKGLEHTLKVFEQFQNFKELKDMKLYVANPGYFPNGDVNVGHQALVKNLGPRTHSNVISEVRSALCVLHLNNVFPETMGLVHAECNAMGTPFLSSRLGATPELADHPGELIDVMDNKAVIERIIQWKTIDRPRVRGAAHLRLSRILREWKELLSL